MLETPGHSFSQVKFVSVHVVGSYVKGKATPNDLDILVDAIGCGKRMRLDSGGILDTRLPACWGNNRVKIAELSAFVWLTRGMKKVHRLLKSAEATEFDVMVEIYPNFNLDEA